MKRLSYIKDARWLKVKLTNLLMKYRETISVCSEMHARQTNAQFLNAEPVGTQKYPFNINE